ncbi:YheU family protein [Shewanella holmiensis]|uniref:YheU family protein n=1 Tax=Shewanella holmiensis TaxID=2952222 RepID=A0A9X2WK19_9GAMM|nr:YheU family protein [Shewanella holmiensis]MCT7940703.1 YheU family protein [Shewanella holmiensis]
MIIPYETLLGLDTETLNNVIKEYLLTQVEDGSFSEFNSQPLSGMINQCKQALKTGELVVEYSEDDESIAIRHRQNIVNSK